MKNRIGLLLAVGLCAVIAVPSSPARVRAAAGPDWTGFRFLGTTCNIRNGLEFAHVRVRMIVHNTGAGTHWASNMRVQARLVSPSAGISPEQSWRTQRFPAVSELLQDRTYWKNMAVNTDTVNPDADWKLEIKLIWDRKVPFPDVVKHFKTTFRGCGGVGPVAMTAPTGSGR
jgi:hypothetical protein